MKNAADFVKECPSLVSSLQKELATAEQNLAKAETESAAWDRLAGTPNVAETTKGRHIKDHREYWRGEVQKLKQKATELRTDIEGLARIA